ncbi:fasciclin-like arabinogalactan protein 2 [Iris pallida]|uniref:Fasciclin-like arabinogalactan protein 2 n=1 Tax=Iris pallida TaxID=29817 RepID=A0AAX6H5S3_IRIPA|nr:fasciclin-like arabinogalactan protein 2 [Iris pallida]
MASSSSSFLLHLLLFLFLSTTYIPLSSAHNITRILADHPDFSTFNHYLSATHLAAEINRRKTITVLALDNAAMSSLLAKHLPLHTLKNVLSLHVLVDYFSAKKLHQITGGTALSSTVFQSTGSALGMAGFVNITDHRAGRVTFCAEGSDVPVAFVRSLREIPYTIAVVQISAPLTSDAAEAPTPAPTQIDIIDLMSKKGCKTFADLLTSGNGTAAKAFESNVAAGLTIFCPIDQAMRAFLPKFNKLTAPDKMAVLLYHGVPAYESLDLLRSHSGPVSTLAATTGRTTKKNYRIDVQNVGSVVTLRTKVTKASITGTLVDEDPLALYTIDEVLEPRELFKPAAKAPAPAPALAPEADAPAGPKSKKKKETKKKKTTKPEEVPAPTPAGPEGEPDDMEVADQNAGVRARVRHCAVAVVAAVAALLVMA